MLGWNWWGSPRQRTKLKKGVRIDAGLSRLELLARMERKNAKLRQEVNGKNFCYRWKSRWLRRLRMYFRGESADKAIGGCDLADVASAKIGNLRL